MRAKFKINDPVILKLLDGDYNGEIVSVRSSVNNDGFYYLVKLNICSTQFEVFESMVSLDFEKIRQKEAENILRALTDKQLASIAALLSGTNPDIFLDLAKLIVKK